MFGKKFLLAVGGYIAGTVVATLFNGKKGEKVRADVRKAHENGEDSKKVILAQFIETHKNFLGELKEMLVNDENKALFDKKVKEVQALVKDYSKQGEALIEELKEKGGEYADTAKGKLEDLYNEKKDQLEEMKSEAPEKVEKLKGKLLAQFDEMKEKIKK